MQIVTKDVRRARRIRGQSDRVSFGDDKAAQHRRNRHYVRQALHANPMTDRLLMRRPLTGWDLD